MDLWLIFLTGLSIGGFSCLAVQGGLLTSIIASRVEGENKKNLKGFPTTLLVLSFLITKFLAYTILGFILGSIGQLIALSENVRIIFQFLAGIYMIILALNLLNLHPIFRKAVLQPPSFLTKKIRDQSKSQALFGPSLLGAMTIFIPCGTTLAMETLAISSGSPLLGALIMGSFTLGTTPLFFSLGYLTSSLSQVFRQRFFKLAAVIIIYLGVLSINGSLVSLNSPITLQTVAQYSPIEIDLDGNLEEIEGLSGKVVGGVQEIDIEVNNFGYSPTFLRVKKGMPVKLNLVSGGVYSCASAFRIPELGIIKNLQPTGIDSVTFTPLKSGRITFACSMGMYIGTIEVL